MIQRMKLFLYFVMFAFVFTACEKELSYEGGGTPVVITDSGTVSGTAGFTFDGGTGICSGAVLSGAFTAGTAVTAANKVVLAVTVNTIGTYAITTSAANGISFSGSGAFTTTGVQDITLTANGNPTTAGTFNFTTGPGGCTFSVTVNAGGGSSGGTAVYTFDGGTATCTGAILAGTYTEGTALTTSNTATLGVNVTTAGTYTISTTAVNGITFSSAGTFTTTGAQTITLTGTGTPTMAGDFAFTPGAGGCSFNVTVQNSGTVTGEYYFDVTVNGERIEKHVDQLIGGYIMGSTVASGPITPISDDNAILSSFITPLGTVGEEPALIKRPSITIFKGMLPDYLTVTDERFKNFLSPGTYSYADPFEQDGVEIKYRDKDLKTWSTVNPSGTQTGSVFTITNSEGYLDSFGDYIVKFTATFNCTLYDDTGNSMQLTNGKFVGEFSKE